MQALRGADIQRDDPVLYPCDQPGNVRSERSSADFRYCPDGSGVRQRSAGRGQKSGFLQCLEDAPAGMSHGSVQQLKGAGFRGRRDFQRGRAIVDPAYRLVLRSKYSVLFVLTAAIMLPEDLAALAALHIEERQDPLHMCHAAAVDLLVPLIVRILPTCVVFCLFLFPGRVILTKLIHIPIVLVIGLLVATK